MDILAVVLFALPFVGAFFLLPLRGTFRSTATVALVSVLVFCSVFFYASLSTPFLQIDVDNEYSHLMLFLDFVLLAFFLYQGLKNSDKTISIMSSIQLTLLAIFAIYGSYNDTPEIRIDSLSAMMYLLVNIAGGIIIIYALGYMRDEETSESRKSYFLALLVAFLGVMNLAVSSDNLEWFFFFFEMTTLFSFLLIGFRDDEISQKNALTALRLNLFGGVALVGMILISVFDAGTLSLSVLLSSSHSYLAMLAVILFCFAGFVKGAQPPFSSWLLGAMVAPTPVSAILHSATMVKIAPFMMLKASSYLHGTFFAMSMSLLLLVSFLVSGYLALKEDNFKKVLAYSTISLLALMMGLALFGTPLALTAAMVLMIFHGISKALLFLQAGILEKAFHIKSVEDFGGLWNKSRSTAFLILFGFLSIIVPPFGAFLAKWLAIESLSTSSGAYLALSTVIVAIGGVVLTLLYFKVSFKISTPNEVQATKTHLRLSYNVSSYMFAIMLFVFAVYIAPITANFFAPIASALTGKASGIRADGLSLLLPGGSFYFWQIVLCALLIMAFSVISFYSSRSSSDSANPYYCGEKKELKLSAFYFASGKLEQKSSVLFGYAVAFVTLFGVFI
jgi:ech hydrogenase subunit A